MTGGVSKGSVLGPTEYDVLWGIKSNKKATIIGFANDIAVMVKAKHKEEVTGIIDVSIRIIHE